MLNIAPVRRALIPVDTAAAQRISAPNYDEFQGDHEIWEQIVRRPECVLRITMPHCNADSPQAMLDEGSAAALALAAQKMGELKDSALTRVVENVLWVVEIVDPLRPVRQIGLGAMARVDDIRTQATPAGAIIRNEGVRPAKARGRAELIRATRSFIGTVNNAVEDTQLSINDALVRYADGRPFDFAAHDEHRNRHLVWLVHEQAEQDTFTALFAAEPCAFVADGNHRSAAAAMLDEEYFLAVFFPAATMGLAPYNRLVRAEPRSLDDLCKELAKAFEVQVLDVSGGFQPREIHDIGLYAGGRWLRLRARPTAWEPSDAVQQIDADIVQRHLFDAVFGIADPRDERLNFVGGDRDAAYLQARVDARDYDYAVTLAPVQMGQFIDVCRQNRIMPPKSTWFQPKIRSGLVMALLD